MSDIGSTLSCSYKLSPIAALELTARLNSPLTDPAVDRLTGVGDPVTPADILRGGVLRLKPSDGRDACIGSGLR